MHRGRITTKGSRHAFTLRTMNPSPIRQSLSNFAYPEWDVDEWYFVMFSDVIVSALHLEQASSLDQWMKVVQPLSRVLDRLTD